MANTPATPEAVAALRNRLAGLYGQFERIQRTADQARGDLARVTGRAESRNGLVRVTVGPGGNLTALEISPRAYQKLSPSLLAEEIMRLVGEAAAEARQRAGDVLSPLLPAGLSYEDLLAGKANLTPAPPTADPASAPLWARPGNAP